MRARLVPGGVLAANVWGPDTNRLHDAMLRTYQEAFPEVRVISLRGRGNRTFLAATGPLPEDATAFARRAREEAERRGYGFDLAALVEEGFARPPRRDSELILRDR